MDLLRVRVGEGSAGYLAAPGCTTSPRSGGPSAQVFSKPWARGLVRSLSTLLDPFPVSPAPWPPRLRAVRSYLLRSWGTVGRGPLSPAERVRVSKIHSASSTSTLPGPDSHRVSISLFLGSLRQPRAVDGTAFITGSSPSLRDKRAELTQEGHRTVCGRAPKGPGLRAGPPLLPPTECCRVLWGQDGNAIIQPEASGLSGGAGQEQNYLPLPPMEQNTQQTQVRQVPGRGPASPTGGQGGSAIPLLPPLVCFAVCFPLVS